MTAKTLMLASGWTPCQNHRGLHTVGSIAITLAHLSDPHLPARSAGADRRLFGGADATADGDRMARPGAARCARCHFGAAIDRTGVSRAADPSPAAFRQGLAAQASHRFGRVARAVETPWRGV